MYTTYILALAPYSLDGKYLSRWSQKPRAETDQLFHKKSWFNAFFIVSLTSKHSCKLPNLYISIENNRQNPKNTKKTLFIVGSQVKISRQDLINFD